MKKKKIVFPALVKTEAKNLRKFATTEEKARLNFRTLSPGNPTMCVYGQMTGMCYNSRSTELIEKSAPRVYKCENSGSFSDRLSNKLNGSPKKSRRVSYWSPIEVFIHLKKSQENGANERLVKYIKGEITRL